MRLADCCGMGRRTMRGNPTATAVEPAGFDQVDSPSYSWAPRTFFSEVYSAGLPSPKLGYK